MGYVCGNCGLDLPSKKKIVEHMIDVHSSPFIEGDELMISHSETHANTKGNEKAKQALAERLR